MTLKSKPRPRLLTRDDIVLWREVARTVAPLHATMRALLERDPTPVSAPPDSIKQPRPELPKASPAQPAPRSFSPLERRTRLRLGRGRLDVEAVLDLHGLREAQAHHALRSFLRGAQQRDARLVLVITGKGGQAAEGERQGVLRRNVPHWLRAEDLRELIVGFEEATLRHGGGGALYVRLRRSGRLPGGSRM